MSHTADATTSPRTRPLWPIPLLVLTLGLAITAWLSVQDDRGERQAAQQRFDKQYERLEAALKARLGAPTQALQSLSSLYTVHGKPNHKTFQTWVQTQDLVRNYQGVRGLGWMEAVPRNALDAFVRQQRAEQGADFHVLTQGQAERLLVLAAIEPQADNTALRGQDASSQTALMETIARAVDLDEMLLTRGLTQADAGQDSDFYYFAPQYRSRNALQSSTDRRAALAGLWVARLNLESLLVPALAHAEGVVDFELLDDHASGPAALAFGSAGSSTTRSDNWKARDYAARAFQRDSSFVVAGRRFSLHGGNSAQLEAAMDHSDTRQLAAAAAALSVLAAVLVWLGLRARRQTQTSQREQGFALSRLSHILQGTSHVVLSGDADQRIVWVNKAFTRLSGMKEEQALGQRLEQLMLAGPKHAAGLQQLVDAIAQRQALHIQLQLRNNYGGELRWFDVKLQIEQDAGGTYTGYIIIASDISAQRQADEQTATVMRENRALMDAIDQHSIVSIADYRGTIIYVNDMFCQISGYSREELVGQNHRILKSDQQDDAFWDSMWKTISSGYSWRATVCNRAKDGRLYWVDSAIAPFFDDAGNIEKYVSIRSDVTAAHIARTELASEREHLSAILEGTDAGTWEWNVPAERCVINSRWAEIIGYTLQELTQDGEMTFETSTGLCHPDDLLMMKELLMEHFAGRLKSYTCEFRMRHREGHWVWVLSSGKVNSWTAPGQPYWISGIHLDITERKQLQFELQKNNQVLHSILEHIPVALSVFDSDLQLVARNDKFLELLDFPEWLFESKATSFESLIRFNAARGEYGSGDVEHAIQYIVERARNTTAHQFERVRPNGRALEVRGAPMPGGGFITTYADISERKQAEEEIRRSTSLLQSVLDAASEVAVISIDLETSITLFNKGAEHMFGLKAETVVGRPLGLGLFDAGELQARSDALSAQAGYPITGLGVLTDFSMLGKRTEWTFRHQDGHSFNAAMVVTAISDSQGKRSGYLCVSFDITQEKKNERALHQAVELAQQAALSKGQFLANMSHEIRTPMNAILGMLKLLQNTELDTRQRDYASKTESAAKSLLGLLNDILDFSKSEAGKMQLDPHPFALDKLMRDLSVILSANTRTADIDVLFDIDPALPPALVGDALRLQQVLINLGGNAIKFTERGEVRVSVQQVARTDTEVRLQIAVQDSGIGIAPDKQQHIFSGFSQAEASTTRRFGGSGLGLSICRRLVEIMGGELRLESTLGQGSRFYFEVSLPLASAEQLASLQLPPEASTPPWRVLLVDDHPQAGALLQASAERLGWQVQAARSGADALAAVKARMEAGDKGFDAILVDWRMPEMDGWQTVQALRALRRLQPRPVILMMTAHQHTMLAGHSPQERVQLDGFLIKPATTSMLRDAVVQAQQHARDNSRRRTVAPTQAQVEDAPPKPKHLDGMRLLVVEDNLINQQVAKELLRAEGADITLASNGQIGVDAVAAANPQFDAVLMDVQMPVMDGYSATVAIRKDLGMERLPIIAMTANAMASDREACLAAGMNDHIGKPFDLPQLIALLLRHTGRSEAGAAAQAEAPQPRDPGVTDALQRLGGNTALYRQIVQSFLDEIQTLPAQLQDLLAQPDLKAAQRLLHTIKGLALTVGATALSDACRDAGTALSAGTANATPSWSALQAPIAEATAATRETLGRVLEDLPAPAEPERAPAAPLEAGALLEQLRALRTLLRNSDMQAQPLFQQLQSHSTPTAEIHWQALQSAMMAFDFARGARECDILIEQLAPVLKA